MEVSNPEEDDRDNKPFFLSNGACPLLFAGFKLARMSIKDWIYKQEMW